MNRIQAGQNQCHYINSHAYCIHSLSCCVQSIESSRAGRSSNYSCVRQYTAPAAQATSTHPNNVVGVYNRVFIVSNFVRCSASSVMRTKKGKISIMVENSKLTISTTWCVPVPVPPFPLISKESSMPLCVE